MKKTKNILERRESEVKNNQYLHGKGMGKHKIETIPSSGYNQFFQQYNREKPKSPSKPGNKKKINTKTKHR